MTLRLTRPEWWALLVIALIGLTRIPEPFYGDQALFTLMARSLHRGATLYVDVWDNKQPGIFLFYELAGNLFGFTEIGVHLFELLYQLITAAVLLRLLRSELRQPILAGLAAVLSVGVYYLSADARHLGQVEGLVGLPILVTLALASGSATSPAQRRARMFGAGVAAGVVALFKLMLAPIPALACLVAYAVHRADEGRSIVRCLTDWLLPAILGTGVVLAGTALWAGLHGGWQELLWTWFTYPVLAVAELTPAPWARLGDSALWFARNYGVAIPLALCAGFGWRGWRKEAVTIQACVWLLMGTIAIAAQRLSYWDYQFLLLVPPLGILAARGADGILARVTWLGIRPRVAVAALLAIVVLTGSRPTLWRVSAAISSLTDPSPLTRYQTRISLAYRHWPAQLAFLDAPDALPGPLYIFGNPLALWFSHREQAGAINGWSWGKYVQPLWDRLPQQLETSRPAYVLVSLEDADLLERRSPATMELLRRDFRVRGTSRIGTWYQRVPPA